MKKIAIILVLALVSVALVMAQDEVQTDISGMLDSIINSLAKINKRLDRIDPAAISSYQVFSDIKSVRITNEDVWKLWGTLKGLEEAGYKIEYQKAVMTTGPVPEPTKKPSE
jgi:hypothetical protein